MSRPVRALNSASSATMKPVHTAATIFDPSGVMTGLNTPLRPPPAGLPSLLMISRDAGTSGSSKRCRRTGPEMS